jgi:hypothetical protein
MGFNMAKLKLTMIDGDQEWSAEMVHDPIKLDDTTWAWLKGAFVAVGFSGDTVEDFFDEQ